MSISYCVLGPEDGNNPETHPEVHSQDPGGEQREQASDYTPRWKGKLLELAQIEIGRRGVSVMYFPEEPPPDPQSLL